MKRGSTAAIWRLLTPFLSERSRWRIASVGASSFLGGIAESAVLVIITLTADSLIRKKDGITLAGQHLGLQTAVLVALIMVVLRVAMTLSASATAAKFSARIMSNAQNRLLTAYLHSTHSVRSTRPPGDLNAVMVNHGRFTGDLGNSFAMLAASLCGLIAFGGTSLVVNPLATLGIAALGVVVIAAMRPLRSRGQAAAKAFTAMNRVVGQGVTEVEGLHREIEVFHIEEPVRARLAAEIDTGAQRFERVRFISGAAPQLFQAALMGAAVLSLLLIVNEAGDANLAAVGTVVLLLVRSMSSAQQLVTVSQRIIEQGSYADGLSELIAILETDGRTYGDQRPPHLMPLHLDHVSFSYDGTHPVLRDLDLTFDFGELVGVVGPSGAGKSTLVELLLRLRSPTAGTITCDGAPIGEIEPVEFARRVAFVPQQPALIAGTVAENVDLFRGLPEDRIVAAIKQAHLETEIADLPDGIHTRLGPDDRSLSGGQQQRLTIARALAGEPEILVLDEPTSALDAVSENAIRQTLSELPHGRVVIVVAHRYSTLRSCSRILVLRDGRIEFDAPPDTVAQQSAFFQTMVSEGA